jgi:hypothetical protein
MKSYLNELFFKASISPIYHEIALPGRDAHTHTHSNHTLTYMHTCNSLATVYLPLPFIHILVQESRQKDSRNIGEIGRKEKRLLNISELFIPQTRNCLSQNELSVITDGGLQLRM